MLFILVLALVPTIWCGQCPCSNATECDLIQPNQHSQEIFGYVLESNQSLWKTFDWTKLTTVAMVDFFDQQLMCTAHRHNARVMKRELFSLDHLDNATFINQWLSEKINFAKKHFLDGINLYVDDPVANGSAKVQQLTKFVELVTEKFHHEIPNSHVVFNIPWAPFNEKKLAVDGKNYDLVAISKIVDQLFMMDYEQRSQSFEEPCLAGANSDFYLTLGSVLAYDKLGVDKSKIVLGLPYYAHDYECVNYTQNMRCYTRESAYRGAKCSSHVAKIVPYNQMHQYFQDRHASAFYDEHSKTRFSLYLDTTYGIEHQVWYDEADLFQYKYGIATQANLRGIGLWCLNYIDQGAWQYLPDFKSTTTIRL